jgi:biotin carboxyl carrier protein
MRRELVAEAGGATRTVIVETTPEGALRVTVDGTPTAVDARRVRAGTWSLLIEQRSYLVDLEPRRGGQVAFTIGASSGQVVLEDARARRLAAAAKRARPVARGETISAPIAGRIVKIHAAVGETVAPGAAVVVLEAMKMENELLCERGGVVSKIYRQAGDSVDTNEKLVELT